MERRPELLSSVMLRQNPHNVHEWHKRAKLFAANPTKQILCYTGGLTAQGAWCGVQDARRCQHLSMCEIQSLQLTSPHCTSYQHAATPHTLSPPAEAVKTVDPERAVGKPHTLWVAFAKLYERHSDLPNARIIFEKAVQVRLGVEGFGLCLCNAVD